MKPEDLAAESANTTYREIRALRKLNLPKREFEEREKALQEKWWQENKHLFNKP